MFRFTFGSLDEATCKFWEPGAPPPRERIAALRHAFGAGFQVSVSAEPMLDGTDEIRGLVAAVEHAVTDTIWIGKMWRVSHRLNAHVAGFAEALKEIRSRQSDREVMGLVQSLRDNPKVRWKDSVQDVLKKQGKPVSHAATP
ncbi:MAG TPA: hypothetical protein PLU30_23485 [Verrucomicrobiae bacterium]|nr:hypothetical protein [Verrucomicrobiae bacterium]